MSNTAQLGVATMTTSGPSDTSLAIKSKNLKSDKLVGPNSTLWNCVVRNFWKGSILGMVAKVGANALLMLLSILRKRKIPSGKQIAALLFPGSARFAIFAGSMLSIFNSVVHFTKDTDENSPIARYRGAIAGALAGTSLVFAPKSMQWSIMTLFLVRAVEMQIKMLIKRRWLPSCLHPDSYGDSFIFAIAGAVQIRFLAMNQGVYNATFRLFGNKFANLEPEQLQALDSMFRGVPLDIPGMCDGTQGDRSVYVCKYSPQ